MNFRVVGKYLSYLILAEAAFLLVPVVVSAIYREYYNIPWLLLSAAICAAIGFALRLACLREPAQIYPREGFVVAGLGWISVSFLGSLPYYFTGEIPHFIDALFESISGFTTTGASVLVDVEVMSRGILFWRSFSHWLGGIGILVFILTIVRAQRGTGSSIHLLRAETTGPQVGKMLPKTRESVRTLYIIYLSLSAACLIFLLAGGMPVFDALCTMFSTAGTGGFGIYNDSLASFSTYIQTVITVFMAVFGVNFTLHYFLVRKEWRNVLKDEELRTYVGIMLGFSLVIAFINMADGMGSFGYSFRHSALTVISMMTGSGFSTLDYDLWPEIARSLLLVVMIFGAMAGSTGGGFKIARVLIIFKGMKAWLHRLTHPRSVKSIRVNGKTLDDEVVKSTYLFLCFYCGILIISFILISFDGHSLESNLSAAIACVNNDGPGLGVVGPTSTYASYSVLSKVVLAIDMLLGRLEIFPILLLFNPATWKRQ